MATLTKRYNLMGGTIFFTSAAFFTYEFILRLYPSLTIEPLMRSFHATGGQIGLLSASYFYACIIMQLFVGPLVDRFNVRWIITCSCAICTITIYTLTLTHSIFLAEVDRFIMGIGSSFAFVIMLYLINKRLNPRWYTLYMTLGIAIAMFAFMACSVFFIALLHHTTWQHISYYLTYAGIAMTLCCFFFIRDDKSTTVKKITFKKILKDALKLFSNWQYWNIFLMNFMAFLPIAVLCSLWNYEFLRQAHHQTTTQASTINSILFAGSGIGSIAFGLLGDLLKHRKKQIALSAIVVLIVELFILYDTNLSSITLSVLYFILGFSLASNCNMFYFAQKLAPPENTGISLAVINMATLLPAAIFQPVVGYILDSSWHNTFRHGARIYTTHSFDVAFLILPIATVLLIGLTLIFKDTF